jgi:uncharacterized membrane protein
MRPGCRASRCLALIYYLGAEFYLIDLDVLDLPVWQAIAISMASLGFGWLAYDRSASRAGRDNTTADAASLRVLVAMAWGYAQVFTGRAALLHLGAFTATIMSANVFFIIIPNQKIVVADLIGRPHAGSEIRQDRQAAVDCTTTT